MTHKIHYKDVCQYGYTHTRCRCMGTTREIRRVDCDVIVHKNHAPEVAEGLQDLISGVNGFYYPGDRSDAIIKAVYWLRDHPETAEQLGLVPDKPTKTLIAEAICDSEQFMWIMAGSNHLNDQIDSLRDVWQKYRENGGGYNPLPAKESDG